MAKNCAYRSLGKKFLPAYFSSWCEGWTPLRASRLFGELLIQLLFSRQKSDGCKKRNKGRKRWAAARSILLFRNLIALATACESTDHACTRRTVTIFLATDAWSIAFVRLCGLYDASVFGRAPTRYWTEIFIEREEYVAAVGVSATLAGATATAGLRALNAWTWANTGWTTANVPTVVGWAPAAGNWTVCFWLDEVAVAAVFVGATFADSTTGFPVWSVFVRASPIRIARYKASVNKDVLLQEDGDDDDDKTHAE